ncbi:MAG: hypothetical protein ACPG1C_08755 [Alphaproteobacteria bacterium]
MNTPTIILTAMIWSLAAFGGTAFAQTSTYGGYGYGNSGSRGDEATAYCWETKSGKYMCDGPTQKMLYSEGNLNRALQVAGCSDGTTEDGSWYNCGRKLESYDRDVWTIRGGANR